MFDRIYTKYIHIECMCCDIYYRQHISPTSCFWAVCREPHTLLCPYPLFPLKHYLFILFSCFYFGLSKYEKGCLGKLTGFLKCFPVSCLNSQPTYTLIKEPLHFPILIRADGLTVLFAGIGEGFFCY